MSAVGFGQEKDEDDDDDDETQDTSLLSLEMTETEFETSTTMNTLVVFSLFFPFYWFRKSSVITNRNKIRIRIGARLVKSREEIGSLARNR